MSIRTSLVCCASAVALLGSAACTKKDNGTEPPGPTAAVVVPGPLPQTTGAYLRVAAADKVVAGTAELSDIREGVEFTATRALLQWPLENEAGDWRLAIDGGLEVKRGDAFRPFVWKTASNGVVTTDALADSEGTGLVELKWVSQTMEQVTQKLVARNDRVAFSAHVGRWTSHGPTLTVSSGTARLATDAGEVELHASACAPGCLETTDAGLCLTGGVDKQLWNFLLSGDDWVQTQLGMPCGQSDSPSGVEAIDGGLVLVRAKTAPGPKLTGTYFPVPAADRINSGDYRPADLAMAVSFKAGEVWIHWPTEDANLKWHAAKAGIEVTRWNGTVNPVSWIETADGTVTTEVFFADGDKPDAMVVKWVPDSFDALVNRWESAENKKAFKQLAGTWGSGGQKLIIGLDKVTWGGKVVAYSASDCREKCGEVAATTCLSPPRNVTGLPTFALIDGAIVEVTWSSICSVTPGEAWGFERVAKGVELHRK